MKYCPNCEQDVETVIINRKEEYKVFGELIEVDAEVLCCANCKEVIFDEELDEKTLQKAYDEYRKKHRMLSRDEIRQIRENYGLSQRSFAKLLGWGDKTIFRYENGSLQDTVHDNLLKLLKEPENMKRFILNADENVPEKIKSRVLKRLENSKDEKSFDPFEELIASAFAEDPSISNGFRSFDYEKYSAMVSYFVKHNHELLKVKLLKLMNYADMCFYAENGISISGSKYVHLTYGPVPQKFDLLFGLMSDSGYIRIKEIQKEDYTKILILDGDIPAKDVLSQEEIDMLDKVNRRFKDFGSARIAEYSHKEKGYRMTEMNEVIPYSYAKDINL